jgi:N-acetylneuraminic acid mutarotase
MLQWTVHLEGGPRRANHASVVCLDRIFSFGGTGEDSEKTIPIDVHVLNPVSYRWKAVPAPKSSKKNDIPYQRYGHTAVAYDEYAYIWGGRNDKGGACAELFQYHPATNTWARPKTSGSHPGARDGHSACVINKKMYIFGGYEQPVDKFSNEVHALDLHTMVWELLDVKGKPASWRDFHTAVGIGSQMYVFGGRSDRSGPYHTSNEVYCNRIHVFDTLSNTWHEPPCGHLPICGDSTSKCKDAPLGRRSHSAFVYNGEMYIFGGFNGVTNKHFSDVHKYNPNTNQWSYVSIKGYGPCARRRQCCCMVGNRLFLFGGTSPCTNKQSHAEDLQDHSDLHVLDFAPSLRTLCMVRAIWDGLDTTILPADVRMEIKAMTTNSNISQPIK